MHTPIEPYWHFIDDERFPRDDGSEWLISRSSANAIQVLEEFGVPHYISFDHDLKGDDTAIAYVNRLFEYVMDNHVVMPPGFDYYVHSQNPQGAANIRGKMDGFIHHRWQHIAPLAQAREGADPSQYLKLPHDVPASVQEAWMKNISW